MNLVQTLGRAVSSFASSFFSELSSSRSTLWQSSGITLGKKSSAASGKIISNLEENERLRDVKISAENRQIFHERYELGKVLGKGHFATVRQAKDKATNEEVAIKTMIKKKLTKQDIQGMIQEIDILQKLSHPNVIRFYGHYETDNYHHIVTELALGGELFDRIVEKTVYSEEDAKNSVCCMINALSFCHKRGVVHRDLKPENILLRSIEDDTDVIIADFGFAKCQTNDLRTSLGTPGYVAPEILQGAAKYTSAVDLWSLGVIIYVLLSGYPPFHAKSKSKLFDQIKQGDFKFHEPYWSEVSFLARDLISKLLVVNPRKRFDVEQVLSHPWVKPKAPTNERLYSKRNLNPAIERLKEYQARRRLRKGQFAVQAAIKMVKKSASINANNLFSIASSQRREHRDIC